MTRRAAGTPIRLASKSVRGRRLIDDTLAMAGFRGIAAIEFVNGGGTGSIGTTAAEPAVTEVGAGSGLYQPSLFDAYRSFSGQPAALFALPVVRRPVLAWSPCSAAATSRAGRATPAACRARICQPG